MLCRMIPTYLFDRVFQEFEPNDGLPPSIGKYTCQLFSPLGAHGALELI